MCVCAESSFALASVSDMKASCWVGHMAPDPGSGLSHAWHMLQPDPMSLPFRGESFMRAAFTTEPDVCRGGSNRRAATL